MTEQTGNPLSLDLASVALFSEPGMEPVAILNEASSLLARLTYCDRAVVDLAMIASLCGVHENIDVQYLGHVFTNQLEPLSNMLGRLVLDSKVLVGVKE